MFLIIFLNVYLLTKGNYKLNIQVTNTKSYLTIRNVTPTTTKINQY